MRKPDSAANSFMRSNVSAEGGPVSSGRSKFFAGVPMV